MVASPVITSCFLKISTSVKLSAIAFSLKAASSVYPRSILIPGLKFNSSSTILFPKLIDPNIIIDNFGLDQFRYFLLREVTLGQDGDFSEKALKNRVNSDLSNNFGNLVQRTIKFLFKNFEGVIPFQLDSNSLNNQPLKDSYFLFSKVEKLITNFELSKGIEEIFVFSPRLIEINKSKLVSSILRVLASTFAKLYPKVEYNLLIISTSSAVINFPISAMSFRYYCILF